MITTLAISQNLQKETCTTTIITLEPCALNAEFQRFVLSCSISFWDLIKCPYFADTTERGDRGVKGGPKRGWRQGYFTDNSNGSQGLNLLLDILFHPGFVKPCPWARSMHSFNWVYACTWQAEIVDLQKHP
jgi:hypothetical protein